MFYFYENWIAHGLTIRIHRGACSFCKDGKGAHGTSNERHGRWHGPFHTYSEAHQMAVKIGKEVSDCTFCTPYTDK
jgi:hypothetical protein